MATKPDTSSEGDDKTTSTRRFDVSSVNKVTLLGYLGADPVLRHTANGTPVATFDLATTQRFTNAAGEKKEDTQWHRVVAWKVQGELVAEHLKKGRQVYLEGRLQYRSYEGKDGETKYVTEIVMTDVTFLGKPEKAKSKLPGEGPAAPLPDDTAAPHGAS